MEGAGSNWRVAVLTDLGIFYRRLGYLSKAMESWEEASRLVLSGRISLDNHIAAAERLEDYRSAWDAVANGNLFNSLLCVSRDLELL